MKRTFRLTALIMALLMLVNISASATTTGIPVGELDIYDFMTMTADVVDVSEDEGDLVLSEPCSEDNEYCVLLSNIIALPTAQQRYDEMLALYSEESDNTTLEGVMLHYYYYKAEHAAEGKFCECDFPSLAPEYQPGALDIHDESCPWTFANLSVAEQYAIVCLMTEDEGAPYLATLNETQRTALEEYINSLTDSDVCDGEACGYNQIKGMTGPERHAKLVEWMNTPAENMGNLYNVFTYHLKVKHPAATEICMCLDYVIHHDDLYYGSFSHNANGAYDWQDQAVTCPWDFDQLSDSEKQIAFKALSTVQRAEIKEQMTADEWSLCTLALSQAETAALEAYLALQNSTDPEDQEKLENVNKTEQEITSGGADENAPSVDASIKVPDGAFDVDYVMNAAASVLSAAQQVALNALQAMHQLAVFDISFEALANGEKLQPNVPVQLTFTVDVSKVLGNTLHVHHLKDNGDGTYTAESLGTVAVDKSQTAQTVTVSCPSFSAIVFSSDCDGSIENGCGINEFIKLNGFEREAELLKYYQTDDGYGSNEYYGFLSCAVTNHMDEVDINELICLCAGYEESPENYHYGDLNHDELCVQWGEAEEEIPCPWHFNQIPVEDQATVLESLDETARETYLGQLNDDQKAALEAYLKTKLKIQLNAKYGEAVITEWLSQQTVTVEMMQRALDASSLDSVVLEGALTGYADLYYVRSGQAIAYYQYNADESRGEIIEPSCQLVVAYVNVETGIVTYALEATAAN